MKSKAVENRVTNSRAGDREETNCFWSTKQPSKMEKAHLDLVSLTTGGQSGRRGWSQ